MAQQSGLGVSAGDRVYSALPDLPHDDRAQHAGLGVSEDDRAYLAASVLQGHDRAQQRR